MLGVPASAGVRSPALCSLTNWPGGRVVHLLPLGVVILGPERVEICKPRGKAGPGPQAGTGREPGSRGPALLSFPFVFPGTCKGPANRSRRNRPRRRARGMRSHTPPRGYVALTGLPTVCLVYPGSRRLRRLAPGLTYQAPCRANDSGDYPTCIVHRPRPRCSLTDWAGGSGGSPLALGRRRTSDCGRPQPHYPISLSTSISGLEVPHSGGPPERAKRCEWPSCKVARKAPPARRRPKSPHPSKPGRKTTFPDNGAAPSPSHFARPTNHNPLHSATHTTPPANTLRPNLMPQHDLQLLPHSGTPLALTDHR